MLGGTGLCLAAISFGFATYMITDETREAMRKILADIQSGEFAKEWIAENEAGQENFQRMREEAAGSRVEQVGKGLRSMMPWIKG